MAGTLKNVWRSLAAVCVLVIGVYAYMAQSGVLELRTPNAADAYYNLLVQSFRAGQLSLKMEAPPGLARLADPYDPAANAPYRARWMYDLSYYKGKLYLYWGATPALLLFWPYVALTGRYLFHRQAVAIFCTIGFLASVSLLRALWRRYFAEVSVGVVAAGALALGLATLVPVLMSASDVYEVPISCGYMLTMLALAAIWRAMHEPERSCRWLTAASVAYGLALGARPTLLFGAVILVVPVIHAWRERRGIAALLLAATVPIGLIGLGLMLYNGLRFDNPFEFGLHYMLGGERLVARQLFRLRYLWFNFRVYFLEPARWSARYPFVHEIAVPPLPAGYMGVDICYGVLSNLPLVWLALAVPLAWRSRSGQADSVLRWFVTAAALLFGICALTLGSFESANVRYEVDFLPALVLLAVVGILGLERALAPTLESGLADRPVWRRAARCGWGLLLGFSVAFNLLASVGQRAGVYNKEGYELFQAGKVSEALGQWEIALRIRPDYAEVHNKLGVALVQLGRVQEAIGHYEQALRISPNFADAHNNLGNVLLQAGKIEAAVGHYEQALRINPDYAEAHCNLGTALAQLGRLQEAMGHWEWALRIKPDYPEAHCNLGNALLAIGKVQEGIGHYEEALRLKPDYVKAHYNLGLALWQTGKAQEAIGHYEEALRLKPDYAKAHYNLGVALEQAGRLQEAIGHYEQALKIQPDFAGVQSALARVRAVQ
jgi:tetratricopeptide (TPR) repeat protein